MIICPHCGNVDLCTGFECVKVLKNYWRCKCGRVFRYHIAAIDLLRFVSVGGGDASHEDHRGEICLSDLRGSAAGHGA